MLTTHRRLGGLASTARIVHVFPQDKQLLVAKQHKAADCYLEGFSSYLATDCKEALPLGRS